MSEAIQETIARLRHQLNHEGELDEADRERLKQIVDEIHQSLDDDQVNSATMAERFHETTHAFTQSHPQLTRTAGQFADMLAQMGI